MIIIHALNFASLDDTSNTQYIHVETRGRLFKTSLDKLTRLS